MSGVVVSVGDPAGVGPELACHVAQAAQSCGIPCRIAAPPELLRWAARRCGLPEPSCLLPVHEPSFSMADHMPGRPWQGGYALAAASVRAAVACCRDGGAKALLTLPLTKTGLVAVGLPYPGHTEWLADLCGVAADTLAMAMVGPGLRLALATWHIPLAAVSKVLTVERIATAGRRLAELCQDLGDDRPLAVCGLNPHAGEEGLLGDEEHLVVVPAVAQLQAAGIPAVGPLPGDTVFTHRARERYAGILALYHDQGLGPFKALCFDTGVNVTLGLPLVRTSPDHGTAFDIAGQGRADPGAAIAAVQLAFDLAQRRQVAQATGKPQ